MLCCSHMEVDQSVYGVSVSDQTIESSAFLIDAIKEIILPKYYDKI